jgi:hypothetical protein
MSGKTLATFHTLLCKHDDEDDLAHGRSTCDSNGDIHSGGKA